MNFKRIRFFHIVLEAPSLTLKLLFLLLFLRASSFMVAQVSDVTETNITKEEEKVLEDKRKAIKDRVHQPILLESSSFKLFFDRKDSTFRLDDIQANVQWNLPIDRRGFATVLIPDAQEKLQEYMVDGVAELKNTSQSIRFRGTSSQGDLPELYFELRITRPLVGLQLIVESRSDFFKEGGAVRILDRALWISDADGGGVLLPVGMGEWYAATETVEFDKTLSANFRQCSERQRSGTIQPGTEHQVLPCTLSGIGLRRGAAGLLLKWNDPGTVIRVSAKKMSHPEFPGKQGIHTSVVLSGEARSIHLYPLGRADLRQLPPSYKQLLTHQKKMFSMRYKTGIDISKRALLGAPIFRVDINTEKLVAARDAYNELEKIAMRLHSHLELDQAFFLLENWGKPSSPESSWRLEIQEPQSGEKSLSDFEKKIHEMKYLYGLVLPLNDRPNTPLSTTESEDLDSYLQNMAATLKPDLIFSAGQLQGSQADCKDWNNILAKKITDTIGLAGASFWDESQFHNNCILDGLLNHEILERRLEHFYPFFPMVYGSYARMAMSSGEVLTPGDADKFLMHLLLGEVPSYRLPGLESDGKVPDSNLDPSRYPFSREGGWSKGKGLSVEERFIKNTFEVASHLARLRFRHPALFYRKLNPEGTVVEIFYGYDLRIVINRGEEIYKEKVGNEENPKFILPKYGFWIQHPFFVAFHALRAFRHDFKEPALFTVRSLEGKLWLRAEKVRIWHGFGPDELMLGGKKFVVPGVLETKIWKK